ncbi:topoisomerase DNA-binding C4 zinc finger domain-containing protein [candidate division KSB1 bacterium]|nr:topoisomerase DNA-binding C4 zinc finger domain-containing protein [candidate division KSB1 bacterium]
MAKISEREIYRQRYQSEIYYQVEVALKPGRMDAFTIPLCQLKSQRNPRLTEPVAKAVLVDLKELSFKLRRFEKQEKPFPPARPFSVSELILHAAVHWRWPPGQTRMLVDQLQELSDPLLRQGVDATLVDETRLCIFSDYGKEYLPATPKRLSSAVNNRNILAPQNIRKTPRKVKRLLTPEQYRLYHLVWSRFLAWQTCDAQLQVVDVEITAGDDQRYRFERKDKGILFRGYMQVYEQEIDIELRQSSYIWPSALTKRDPLRLVTMSLIKEKTAPPPRFSPRTLKKNIIADGSDIQLALAQLISEQYLILNGQGLEPTDKGLAVPLPEDFVPDPALASSRSASNKGQQTAPAESVAREKPAARMTCPLCGKRLVERQGRYGRFLACSGYPACRHTQPIALDIPCPEKDCNGHLVERRTAKGKIFYGCSEYPRCRHAQWQIP